MLPILGVYAVVSDLGKINEVMVDVLGIRLVQQFRDDQADMNLYALANAFVAVIAPHHAESPAGQFLRETGGGFFGFELIERDSLKSEFEGTPIVGSGSLSQIRFQELPESKIRLLKGLPSDAVLCADDPIALDHLAYVVHDIDTALRELGKAAHVGESTAVGRWDFPEFGSTNAIVPLYQAFVEFNQATGKGMFETAYTHFGPSALFICLRVQDLQSRIEKLRQSGVNISDSSPVRATPVGKSEQQILGQVAGISLRHTQGARIMLLEPDWPWNIIHM